MQFSVNFTVTKITIYLDNDVQKAQPTVLSVILVEKDILLIACLKIHIHIHLVIRETAVFMLSKTSGFMEI